MANSRQLGISGRNLATKKAKKIQPSNFEIAGLIGRFRRQFDKAFELNDSNQLDVIFGERVKQWYGHDGVIGFFQNSEGGSLFVKSHIGNSGGAIDAVTASKSIDDDGSNPALVISDGYKETKAYGSYGNNTQVAIEQGNRYETTLANSVSASDTEAEVVAIGDIQVGDIVRFDVTSGPVYKKITEIDEANGLVKWSGVFDASLTGSIGDAVEVLGFRLRVYKKSSKGVVEEVETRLGAVFCTMESEVTDYYVENVHKENQYIVAEDQGSASTLADRIPATTAQTALENGADGTAPTTSTHWSFNHSAFDNKPVRMIGNIDAVGVTGYADALESYALTRVATDFPTTFPAYAKKQTLSALKSLGASLQRSRAILQIYVETWLKIVDPFTTSPIAPPREVPNTGHVMGAWIRATRIHGIHWVPATSDIDIRGVVGVVQIDDDEPFSDAHRTELFDSGVNIIQDRPNGVQIRNWVTTSKLQEYRHGNVLIMRNFIRESVKESLTDVENEPNVFDRLESGRTAIESFMNSLWRNGSNDQAPEGETFGQLQDPQGSPTTAQDHYEVIADPGNNPAPDVLQGERDYDIFFSAPTPTGSISVGVGVLVPSFREAA